MTYFEKPDHSYHRVIFEFTDTEMKDAGFYRTSKQLAILEMIRLVRRIAEDRTIKGDKDSPEVVAKAKREVAKLQADMINSWPDEDGTPTPEDEKSKEAYLSETQEIMKRLSRDDHTKPSQVLNIVPDNMELKSIENRLDPDRKYRESHVLPKNDEIEEKSMQDLVNSCHYSERHLGGGSAEPKILFCLQRKKDAWKAKALRLIGFLNSKDEVIKRLLRENKHYRDSMTEGGL